MDGNSNETNVQLLLVIYSLQLNAFKETEQLAFKMQMHTFDTVVIHGKKLNPTNAILVNSSLSVILQYTHIFLL